MTMRVGFVPTVFRIRSMIGSSMPASVMMPKNRIAKTNMPTTGARLWMPETMNLLVSQPNPPISAAAMGMRMSAINGDIHFVMMTVSRRAMVTRPRTASICASLSRLSPSCLRGCWSRRHAAKGMIRQLNLFDISNKYCLMDVSLRQVRSFLTVARVKSFTGAASILNVTQPALTMQIRRLEEALGVTLFDRDTRSVELTRVARDLIPAFERTLQDFDAALDSARDIATQTRGIVRLAVLPSVAAGVLPDAILGFRE